MTRPSMTPTSLLLALGLVLAGCGGGLHGPGMMGAGGGSGANMMGSSSGYSQLSCSAPTFPAEQRVDVTVADMGMTSMMGGVAPMGSHMMLSASPVTVPAGQVTLVASNLGWRTHELVVMTLSSGASAGQRVVGPDGKVPETGSLGEASASCAEGSGEGITSGQVGWITLTLAPGRYELLCNLQNHYSSGMYLEFTVT
ncbi:hypothetical protein EH165_12700 [Nakamurella antarctica]|uniref:Sulfocyanin-like C-terminal domain-containing protein n=1 Tax=Nakamurella antarctica TaxID=1902245 RepID=A0A3G8ZNJ6_9ACTN|nr:sulfocyanin-like copper-binding protein [Nakamurella antarctica]AZI58869.1 hypothetical protein EH165_12700 [Nakamurella antarctica]